MLENPLMHCVLVAVTKKSSANKDRQGIKKYKVGKLKKVDNNWHMWFMFVSTFKVSCVQLAALDLTSRDKKPERKKPKQSLK